MSNRCLIRGFGSFVNLQRLLYNIQKFYGDLYSGESKFKMQPLNQRELSGKSASILLVDDEPAVRTSMTEILQLKGYDVFQAENGRRALEIYETERSKIDLILLDMTMPVLTGLETLQRIREQDGKLPVILLSGYGEEQIDNLTLERLNARFLKKPFKVNILLQIIQEVLDKRPREANEW